MHALISIITYGRRVTVGNSGGGGGF